MFRSSYDEVFDGDERWNGLDVPEGDRFAWDDDSTYVRNPPFFEGMEAEPEPITDIEGARVLAKLGDSVTTDHISPAGAIKKDSPAGEYLMEHGVERKDFNSYGSRRGNHEVMMRGTFANIRLRNELAPGTEGGVTRYLGRRQRQGDGEEMAIYDAAMKYAEEGTPLVVLAGKEYGSGSSRDWAAKGTNLLGVRAVHRRVLRAHPPLEPRRHGRAAAAVLRRRVGRVARADRRGDLQRRRPRGLGRRRPAHADRQGGRQGVRGDACGSTPRRSRSTTVTAAS